MKNLVKIALVTGAILVASKVVRDILEADEEEKAKEQQESENQEN